MASIFAGLCKPMMRNSVLARFSQSPPAIAPSEPRESALFSAYANTLIAVIVLFAGYLAFGFQTLWLKEFPPGFYYSIIRIMPTKAPPG